MKAYVCREFGPVDTHKIEEIEDPRAEPGMVVIDVKAAGVSFPDVLIVQEISVSTALSFFTWWRSCRSNL